MTINKCKTIELPIISDPRGDLSFVEFGSHINFRIERVYYLYNIPKAAERGGHAHKALHQLIIPLAGSFDVLLDDGVSKKTFSMNSPNIGLYVCPMIWRELSNFSVGSVCMVLASNLYDENDYYRNYNEFMRDINL